ncbi:MAG TPA: glycosyltransferase family 2 protein [Phycisphaerales bacterium]|nr:glycosyltransferase family 2 protein [Phycisphaerales bacterium]
MDDTVDNPFSVSVVMPAYNAQEHIRRAIDSVLGQTKTVDAIIVVDDGSTDRTAEIVSSYGSKVQLIRQQNAGPAAARNAGIKAARSEWIAFLDADDEWLAEKIERQSSLLMRNRQLVWSSSNFIYCKCDEDHRYDRHTLEEAEKLLGGKEYFDDYFSAFADDIAGYTGVMMVRKDVLEEVGLFPTDMTSSEDTDTWWRIAYEYPNIGHVVEPLTVYHIQVENSITAGHLDAKIIDDLVTRHLAIAESKGHSDRFLPCASKMIRYRIRFLQHQERLEDIRMLVEKFGAMLPLRFKLEMRVRFSCPKAGPAILGVISVIKKTYRCVCKLWKR